MQSPTRRRLNARSALSPVLLGLGLAALAAGCRSGTPTAAPEARPAEAAAKAMQVDPLEPLVRALTGRFSTARQARRDADFHDVRLVQVPIWPDRPGGRWLYVEQSLARAQSRPYRQRVLHIMMDTAGDQPRIDIYHLPGDPLRFAGAWRESEPLADLSPDDLEPGGGDGCSIYVEPAGEAAWTGATRGESCRSTVGGAAYATTELVITPQSIHRHDRGFNADGEQVWGTTDEPYIFDRVDG